MAALGAGGRCGRRTGPGLAEVRPGLTGGHRRLCRRHPLGAGDLPWHWHAPAVALDARGGDPRAPVLPSDRTQPALSRPLDRLHPRDHTGRLGPGIWLSLERPRLLRRGRGAGGLSMGGSSRIARLSAATITNDPLGDGQGRASRSIPNSIRLPSGSSTRKSRSPQGRSAGGLSGCRPTWRSRS